MVMDVHRLDTSPDHDSAMVCPGSVFDGVAVSDPDDALVQVGSPPPPPPPTGIAAAGGEPDSANAIKADTPTTQNRDRQLNTPLTLVALLNEPNMRTLPGNLDFHPEAFHPVPSRSPQRRDRSGCVAASDGTGRNWTAIMTGGTVRWIDDRCGDVPVGPGYQGPVGRR